MKKTLAASKDLMKNYLSELLTEEVEEQTVQPKMVSKQLSPEKEKLSQLLQQASVVHDAEHRDLEVITSRKSENKDVSAPTSTRVIESTSVKEEIKQSRYQKRSDY